MTTRATAPIRDLVTELIEQAERLALDGELRGASAALDKAEAHLFATAQNARSAIAGLRSRVVEIASGEV